MATYLLCRYGHSLGLVHHPNTRSSHRLPVPCGGGLAMVMVFVAALFVLELTGQLTLSFSGLLISMLLLLAAVGLYDDIAGLAVGWRLLTHCVIVVGTIYLATSLGEALWPTGWPLKIVIMLCLLWWLNLYNFMDGLDGTAAIEGLFIAGAWLLLASSEPTTSLYHSITTLTLLLLAVLLGFLGWNWSPARIFMGDVGSTFLGFCLAILGLLWVTTGALSLWSCLLLTGVFTVDASVTLLCRILQGKCLYKAHREHAYQQYSDLVAARSNEQGEQARALAHRRVCYGVILINILWLLPWALLAQYWSNWGMLIGIVAWLPLIIGCGWFKIRLKQLAD